jgi:predicted transcriptional regulator
LGKSLDSGFRRNDEIIGNFRRFAHQRTLFHHPAKRLQLLQELHKIGCVSISALARHLHRHYKNVFSDLKTLEAAGLVEKTDKGLYCVPWDEFTATVKLAS